MSGPFMSVLGGEYRKFRGMDNYKSERNLSSTHAAKSALIANKVALVYAVAA